MQRQSGKPVKREIPDPPKPDFDNGQPFRAWDIATKEEARFLRGEIDWDGRPT